MIDDHITFISKFGSILSVIDDHIMFISQFDSVLSKFWHEI